MTAGVQVHSRPTSSNADCPCEFQKQGRRRGLDGVRCRRPQPTAMSPAVAADVIQRPGVRMVSVKRLRSTGSSMAERARPRTVIRVQSDAQPSNIDLMEDLENATPFELAWPSANSSSAISLYDFWPPFGSLQNLQDWWAEPWLVTGYQPGPGKNRVVADLVARTAHCVSARRLLAGGLLTYCVPQMTVQVAKAVELRGSVACNHCRANAELIVAIANPKDGRTLCVFRCECGKLTSTRE